LTRLTRTIRAGPFWVDKRLSSGVKRRQIRRQEGVRNNFGSTFFNFQAMKAAAGSSPVFVAFLLGGKGRDGNLAPAPRALLAGVAILGGGLVLWAGL
jgi:hypothetical protein